MPINKIVVCSGYWYAMCDALCELYATGQASMHLRGQAEVICDLHAYQAVHGAWYMHRALAFILHLATDAFAKNCTR